MMQAENHPNRQEVRKKCKKKPFSPFVRRLLYFNKFFKLLAFRFPGFEEGFHFF